MRHAVLAHRPRLFAAIMVLGCAGLASGQSRDAARFFPQDTLLYVGWSELYSEGSSTAQWVNLIRGIVAAEAPNDDEARAVLAAIDLGTTALRGTGGVALLELQMAGPIPDIQAALVVHVGSDADKLGKGVADLLRMTGAPEPEPANVAGLDMQRISTPELPFPIYWGVHEGHFFLVLGESAAMKVAGRLRGEGESLADNPDLKFHRQKVGVDLDTLNFAVYGDMRSLIAKGKAVANAMAGGDLPPIVDQVIEELGFNSVKSKSLHCFAANGQSRSMYFARMDGPYRGLLTLWKQQPLSDDDLRIVPKDAYWAHVSNLDLTALWREGMRVVEALAPDQKPMIDNAVAESAQMLGFSVPEDLLPAFGDTWALFDAPSHGGLLFTGTVLVAEVRDADKLQRILGQIIELARGPAAEEDVELTLKSSQRGPHKIHYVAARGVPFPIAPAWGFVGGRWVVGLTPQTVAVAMKQIDSPGSSILDQPDFKAARGAMPATVTSVTYVDSDYFLHWYYPIMLAMQTVGVSMTGQDVDLAALPTLPEELAETTNAIGTSSTDADGVLYTQIGDGLPIGLVFGAAAVASGAAVPALFGARETAQATVSAANLRGIGQACMIYANDNQGEFPESFAQLVEMSFISREMLSSPRQLDAPEAYIYVKGHDENGDPRSIVAYERPIGDGSVIALFLDGHVENMPIWEFEDALRETYKRLGREEDMPTDLGP